MLLAFTDNIDRVTEITQKQLDYAEKISFPAYTLILILILGMSVIAIHLLCFVRPDAQNRRDVNAKMADAFEKLADSSVKTAVLLEANNDWQSRHDDRLNRWEVERLQAKCPLLDKGHDVVMPIVPHLPGGVYSPAAH